MTSLPIFIEIKFNFFSNEVGFECVGGTWAILETTYAILKTSRMTLKSARSEILPESFLGHTETYKSTKSPLLKRSYFWSTPSAMPRNKGISVSEKSSLLGE